MVAAVVGGGGPPGDGGRVLVALRPADKRHGGMWEFPGGKVEAGESTEEALRRELAEELGVRVVRVGPVLHEEADPGSPFRIRFVETEVDGEPRSREHEALRLVSWSEALELRLAPADRAFVLHMQARPGGTGPERT